MLDAILVYRDHTYQWGRLAGIRASLAWLEDKGNIGLLLKVTGTDFPNADKQDMTARLFRVDHAFVSVDGKVFVPENSGRCEEPAAFCGGYWFPASVVINSGLLPGKLAIGFNREPKGLDISLPLIQRKAFAPSPTSFGCMPPACRPLRSVPK